MKVTEVQQRQYHQQRMITQVLGQLSQDRNSFSMWRMPHTQDVFLLVSETGPRQLATLDVESARPGFAIAPFLPHQPKYFLEADYLYRFTREELQVKGQLGWEKKDMPTDEEGEPTSTIFLHFH